MITNKYYLAPPLRGRRAFFEFLELSLAVCRLRTLWQVRVWDLVFFLIFSFLAGCLDKGVKRRKGSDVWYKKYQPSLNILSIQIMSQI